MKQIQRAGLIEAMEAHGAGRRKRLRDISLPSSTYYDWRKRYEEEGTSGLAHKGRGRKAWNRLTDREEAMVLRAAHGRPELSPRLLAIQLLDEEGVSISKSTVFRILKAHGLITPRPLDQNPAGKQWRHKTTRPDEIYQCDATMFLIPGWGRYEAIPVLDDYSRKLMAVPLMPDETSESIACAMEEALENASHLAMADVNLLKIARLMGHSNVQATQIYAHLQPSSLREAVFRLPAIQPGPVAPSLPPTQAQA